MGNFGPIVHEAESIRAATAPTDKVLAGGTVECMSQSQLESGSTPHTPGVAQVTPSIRKPPTALTELYQDSAVASRHDILYHNADRYGDDNGPRDQFAGLFGSLPQHRVEMGLAQQQPRQDPSVTISGKSTYTFLSEYKI